MAIQEIGQDVRFSARLLARDRRFTFVAVLALALGIGANNTLFTVVNAICIRGLPFAGVDRLVDVSNRPGVDHVAMTTMPDIHKHIIGQIAASSGIACR